MIGTRTHGWHERLVRLRQRAHGTEHDRRSVGGEVGGFGRSLEESNLTAAGRGECPDEFGIRVGDERVWTRTVRVRRAHVELAVPVESLRKMDAKRVEKLVNHLQRNCSAVEADGTGRGNLAELVPALDYRATRETEFSVGLLSKASVLQLCQRFRSRPSLKMLSTFSPPRTTLCVKREILDINHPRFPASSP